MSADEQSTDVLDGADLDQSGDCDGPQAAHDYDEAYKVASEYYDLLTLLPDADQSEIARLKARLDALLAPYNVNPAWSAYVDLLERKRLVSEGRRERIFAARAELARLDGVVTPEIMGDVLWNLRRILEE